MSYEVSLLLNFNIFYHWGIFVVSAQFGAVHTPGGSLYNKKDMLMTAFLFIVILSIHI